MLAKRFIDIFICICCCCCWCWSCVCQSRPTTINISFHSSSRMPRMFVANRSSMLQHTSRMPSRCSVRNFSICINWNAKRIYIDAARTHWLPPLIVCLMKSGGRPQKGQIECILFSCFGHMPNVQQPCIPFYCIVAAVNICDSSEVCANQ